MATLAWLCAVHEIVTRWLHREVPDLEATIPALTRMLLRSIGAGPKE